jgi:hypothetical protein
MPCTATSRDLNSSLLAFAVISSCMMWPARVTPEIMLFDS